jgi:hypothetical protein
MEERFEKYPDENNYPKNYFAEPGRYESALGVTKHGVTSFTSDPPIVRFSHNEDCYGWRALGNRKRMANIRAFDIPYWGSADKLLERIYGIQK